ncbi:MAG: heme biosynthesis HemY N-terminal domain-containing protein [Pseudomonadota bacterium]
MIRISTLLIIALVILVVGLGAYWLFTLPGTVSISVPGTTAELSVGLALLLLVSAAMVLAVAWWLLTSFVALPFSLGRARRHARTRKANRALTEGLLAAEAGDAQAALKLARKAGKHAEDDRLKLLLEARAAEASEDWTTAEQAWSQLMRAPGGELAGLRGAAAAAIQRGDTSAAETRAGHALALKSGAEWPFNSLFDLQVNRQEWGAALQTLAIGEKRRLIEGERLKRRRAVLLTALATELTASDRMAAQRALAEALRIAPGFPPAAWFGARHLASDGKIKAAQGLLVLAWKARPHPALSQLCRKLDRGGTVSAQRQRLEDLVAANPGHRESRILQAELAMDAEKWVDAVRVLAVLVEENPTARLCLLMVRALTGYGDAAEAERWAKSAATASREADWSDLDPKGTAFDYSPAEWSRMVYGYGDVGDLLHPRHEAFAKELDASRQLALPAPASDRGDENGGAANTSLPGTAPPLDYAQRES